MTETDTSRKTVEKIGSDLAQFGCLGEQARDTLRALLVRGEKAEISLSQMRDYVAEIEGFSEDVADLVAATRRQVQRIEHWLDGGGPAWPSESKSIYQQMKDALEPFGGTE